MKKRLKELKYTRKIKKNEKFGANEALLASYIILLYTFSARYNEGRNSKRRFEGRLKNKKIISKKLLSHTKTLKWL